MKLQKKNKRVERELPSFLKGSLEKINEGLLHFAERLQKTTNRYSTKRKRILLLVFVVAFSGESVLAVIQSLRGGKKGWFTVSRIKTVPLQNRKVDHRAISAREFQRLLQFKNYIDSLGTTGAGKNRLDSILKIRRGLMDSVNSLLRLYLEQSKTK